MGAGADSDGLDLPGESRVVEHDQATPCSVAEPCPTCGADVVESIYEEAALLRQLVAFADQMFAEQAAKAQAESDARYQAEFGHNGPRLAGPLGSAGRTYVYNRHVLGRRIGLPDAAVALGQVTP